MTDKITGIELPGNWDLMTQWQKRVWRYPDTPALKRQQNREWRAQPGNAELRKAYWESRKDYHRGLVRENTRKMREKMIAELGVEECRRIWREEKAKRMEDPEKRKKIYDAHSRWRNSDQGKAYNAREDIRESKRAIIRKCRLGKKPERAAYMRKKRAEDVQFRIGQNLRGRINEALRGRRKFASSFALLGCTLAQFKGHLESRFTGGMSWENYGKVWQIDHIRPCVSFDLSDKAQQRQCFHFSNCRPLCKIENAAKGSRYSGKPIGQLPLLMA